MIMDATAGPRHIELADEIDRPARPSWDEYFCSIVAQISSRSTCLRRQVGALIVKEKRILATGYNGAPSGLTHCLDVGCIREENDIASGERHELCRGLHAEQNSIIQAALHGVSIAGATIYCTHQPCSSCAKMIINSGIVRVIFLDAYPDDLAQTMMTEAGVSQQRFTAGPSGESG